MSDATETVETVEPAAASKLGRNQKIAVAGYGAPLLGALATAGLVGLVGLYLVVTRDRGVSIDVADAHADAHADSARARAQDELDAAVEAGRRAEEQNACFGYPTGLPVFPDGWTEVALFRSGTDILAYEPIELQTTRTVQCPVCDRSPITSRSDGDE